MKTFGAVAIFAVLFVGCGPSLEVQYLQAAEEVRTEEARLQELRSQSDAIEAAMKSDLDRLTTQSEALKALVALKLMQSNNAGNADKIQAEAIAEMTERSRKYYEERQQKLERLGEVFRNTAAQQKVVDAAIARRDSFATK